MGRPGSNALSRRPQAMRRWRKSETALLVATFITDWLQSIKPQKGPRIAVPISILAANSMLGEVTPGMAAAIGSSKALKLLLPIGRSRIEIVGVLSEPLPHLVEKLVQVLKELQFKKEL